MFRWLRMRRYKRQLASGYSSARCGAVESLGNLLGKLGDSQAVAALIEALSYERGSYYGSTVLSSEVTQAVKRSLRNIGGAYDVITSCLSNDCAEHREEVIWALGATADPRALEPLTRMLRHEKYRVRLAAIQALGLLGDIHAAEPLFEEIVGVHSGCPIDETYALEVQEHLRMGARDASRYECVKKMDGDLRQEVAKALRALGEPKWCDIVKGDGRDFGRLSACGDTRLVEPLIRALHDGNEQARCNAADVLGGLGDLRAVTSLISALQDKNQGVVSRAIYSLGRLGDSQGLLALIDALRSDLHSHAVEALAFGRWDVARDGNRIAAGLVGALAEGPYRARRAAVDMLRKLGEPHWGDIVKGDDEDFRRLSVCDDTRINPVESLIRKLLNRAGDIDFDKMTDAGEIAAVERVLSTLDDSVLRKNAAFLLGKVGTPQAVPPLLELLVRLRSQTRRIAAEFLARLGCPQWQELVTGSKEDLARLASSETARAIGGLLESLQVSIKYLVWRLNDSQSKVRIDSAKYLIAIAKSCPELLRSNWHTIAQKVRAPLGEESSWTSVHKDYAGEIYSTEHYSPSWGCGLDFPDAPPDFR